MLEVQQSSLVILGKCNEQIILSHHGKTEQVLIAYLSTASSTAQAVYIARICPD